MFKLALDAGHYLKTPGKRLNKMFDPSQTREWVLNDRVADYIIEYFKNYDGIQILRVDDATGKTEVTLAQRCKKANDWGADFYLSAHHDAGASCTATGGITAYSCPNSTKGAEYRDAIYKECIAAGGLKGNRSRPMNTANYYVLKHTNMPAVLMEYGFMDSSVDAPIILTEKYSKLVGYATAEAIAKKAGLKKTKPETETKEPGIDTTEAFIRKVQKAINAKVDGIAGPETLSKTVTVSAKYNKRHAVVKILQERLYELGYVEVGTADGIAGSKFTSAVMHFQRDNGCVADGIISARNKTWKKILGIA